MKKAVLTTGVAIMLLSFYYPADNKRTFKKLFSLEGVWKIATKKGTLCEEWKKIGKNYLQNKGYIIKGSDTLITERVALTRTTEGIFYTSTVEDQNNKKPVVFKMTSASNNRFIFENPKHDFPKQIFYQLVSADSLHAFIDDGVEGTTACCNGASGLCYRADCRSRRCAWHSVDNNISRGGRSTARQICYGICISACCQSCNR